MTDSFGYGRYEVRAGDTLKTVATNHPALADARLWRLLAEVNQISCQVDEHGNACAELVPGTFLTLPTEIQIEQFRQRENAARLWQTGGSASPAEDDLASIAPPTEPDMD